LHDPKPGEPDLIDAALALIARPAVWIGFLLAFAGLLGLLLAFAAGGEASGARFDYDLF
jgi:hypothetical protein